MTDEELDALARTHLGAGVAARRFDSCRRAQTCGVRLDDGREVVIKLHPPDATAERLAAAQSVQGRLAEHGFPCPAPLLAPTPAGGRLATAETLLDSGRRPDPRRRADRAAMAATLAEVTRLSRPLRHLAALDAERIRPPATAGPWPPPADPRLSFDYADARTERIDALGLRARARRRAGAAAGPPVIGHGDWNLEHVRLHGPRAVAVYDWDSLLRAPEPFIVGCAVAGFTSDWSVHEPPVVPGLGAVRQFIADYEAARGDPFSPAERGTVHAHWVEIIAYAARLELARERAGLPVPTRYRSVPLDQAERLLPDH